MKFFFEKFHIFLEAKMLVMRYDIIFSEIFSVFYLQVTEIVSTFAPALREKHSVLKKARLIQINVISQ